MSRFVFTQHAIDRFLQRCDGSMSRDDVTAALHRGAMGANRLREKTKHGQERWKFHDPPVTVIVKRDPGQYGTLVGVTILPNQDTDDSNT